WCSAPHRRTARAPAGNRPWPRLPAAAPAARAADRAASPEQMPQATPASVALVAARLASAPTVATASAAHVCVVLLSSLASHDNAGAHRLTVATGGDHLDRLPAPGQTQTLLFQRGEVAGPDLQG